LSVRDDTGEVVGQAREQSGSLGERVDVRGGLGDHDHLPSVGAAALQDRDAALRGHLDHRPELVQQQRPRRAGMLSGVVQISEREHRQGGGLVGHRVGVGAPHHDRPLTQRLDQPHRDAFPVRRGAWSDERAAGERERDLEPERAARQIRSFCCFRGSFG